MARRSRTGRRQPARSRPGRHAAGRYRHPLPPTPARPAIGGSPRRTRPRTGGAGRWPASTRRRPRPACACCARAATPSTPPWPPRPRSGSPSPTPPASAAAATSSTSTDDRPGQHPRRPRDRAGRRARDVPRPGDGAALPLRRSWSPAASRSGCPARRPPGSAPWTAGAPSACGSAPARRPDRPPRLRRRRHLPHPDPGNKARFSAFSTTADLYLPGGDAPVVGSVFRNPDLAATYEALGREGTDVVYRGRIGADIVRTVQDPPGSRARRCRCPPGR